MCRYTAPYSSRSESPYAAGSIVILNISEPPTGIAVGDKTEDERVAVRQHLLLDLEQDAAEGGIRLTDALPQGLDESPDEPCCVLL